MDSVKIYPSIEELTTITNLVYCTEDGCGSVFKSESNLNLHLAKRHKNEDLANLLIKRENDNREYHCPDHTCVYNSLKFFKNLKLLKQHYLKVHSSKDIFCEKCSKGFATEASRNSHEEYCGTNFKCCDCEAAYTCYDTLNTHGRRKKHKILPKTAYRVNNQSEMYVLSDIIIPSAKKPPKLLQRPSSTSDLLLKMTDKSSQTDIFEGQPKSKTRKTINKKHISNNETQTAKNKQPQLCAETQTIGDYFVKKTISDVSSSSSTESLNRKNINTQTITVTSSTKSCNTSLNLDEIKFPESDVEKSSLGTQTLTMLSSAIYNSSVSNDDLPGTSTGLNFEFIDGSCQTNFTEPFDAFDSCHYLNCNTETQTEYTLGVDIPFFDFQTDFYSNMCTQTCDNIFSADMEFSNNHTQTVTDDILRTVGSQTTMILNKCCKDRAHNETQTEIAFKRLEEINA